MLPGDYQFTMQKEFKLDRYAFEAWLLEGGTLEKARHILAKKGIINRRRNEPYTKMGIQQAAYRYIVENQVEVRPIMENIWKGYGVTIVTNDSWNKYIVRMAMMVLGNSSKKRFMGWLDKNPEFKEYEYMYAIRFGIEADKRTEDE
jgi:hypothetical protein